MGYVDMLEADTEGSNPFRVFCLKESEYIMKIMALWMTLDNLEGAKPNCSYKGRDGEPLVKIFKYRQPFGFKFIYRLTTIDATIIYQ